MAEALQIGNDLGNEELVNAQEEAYDKGWHDGHMHGIDICIGAVYSNRNRQPEYPSVPGFYWYESIKHGWLAMARITAKDIELDDSLKEKGILFADEYLYSGPIPEPRGRDNNG